MSGGRWVWVEDDTSWHPKQGATKLPDLIENEKPEAGRILGPTGKTISIVRYGPTPAPFGFAAKPDVL